MPRRYFDYLPQFHVGHFISSVGAIILVTGVILMLYNLIKSRKGEIAPANPWHGSTLEWQIPSPPPLENFDKIPVITQRPYHYNTDDLETE